MANNSSPASPTKPINPERSHSIPRRKRSSSDGERALLKVQRGALAHHFMLLGTASPPYFIGHFPLQKVVGAMVYLAQGRFAGVAFR